MGIADVTGLVFAGGEGRRMGGRDKGLVPFRGRPLVESVIERLSPQVGQLLVSANRNRDAYAATGHPIIADTLEGYAGPLAGLLAGLDACNTPLLATAPCDAPLLPLDLVARLRTEMDACDAPVVVARTGGRLQPTFMLCRRTLKPNLEEYLSNGGRKVQVWLAAAGAHEVLFPDLQAFANANTPEDIAELEREA
jgi:molybdopterin-guanine dinucleotide biosynthesis protein A